MLAIDRVKDASKKANNRKVKSKGSPPIAPRVYVKITSRVDSQRSHSPQGYP